MKIFEKNSLPLGLLIGVCLPLIGFGILQGLFWILSQLVNSTYGDWRLRTIALLAICFNLIPFNAFQKKKNDNSMRGVMIPTVILGIAWAVYYYGDLNLG